MPLAHSGGAMPSTFRLPSDRLTTGCGMRPCRWYLGWCQLALCAVMGNLAMRAGTFSRVIRACHEPPSSNGRRFYFGGAGFILLHFSGGEVGSPHRSEQRDDQPPTKRHHELHRNKPPQHPSFRNPHVPDSEEDRNHRACQRRQARGLRQVARRQDGMGIRHQRHRSGSRRSGCGNEHLTHPPRRVRSPALFPFQP